MLVIGIAGGIASGKSTVARLLAELGAVGLDADGVGHRVLFEPSIKQRIRETFGEAVFDSHGEIVRSRLAQLVFGIDKQSRANLRKLEAIVHPEIGQILRDELGELRITATAAVVLDAAVMFEAGWDTICDRIVFVRASKDIRRQRALSRGWTNEQFEWREANQTDLSEKEKRSTDFVDNPTNNLQQLRSQVKALWLKWGLPLDSTNAVNSTNS